MTFSALSDFRYLMLLKNNAFRQWVGWCSPVRDLLFASLVLYYALYLISTRKVQPEFNWYNLQQTLHQLQQNFSKYLASYCLQRLFIIIPVLIHEKSTSHLLKSHPVKDAYFFSSFHWLAKTSSAVMWS